MHEQSRLGDANHAGAARDHTAAQRSAQLWAGGFETPSSGLVALVAVGEMK
jgi:hypothetical protein